MHLHIEHTTRYTYDEEARFAVQRLQLTPTDTKGQKVLDWSIEAPGFENSVTYVNGFDCRVHLITQTQAHGELVIHVAGHVDTIDTGGIVGFTNEGANPDIFLRETDLTTPSDPLRQFAEKFEGPADVSRMHDLLTAIGDQVYYDTDATNPATTAAESFASRRGVCQDHAHIFMVVARLIGVPARYVTGYLDTEEDGARAAAHHAWAETFIPEIGWVGFDPANHVCPTERYVRLAVGMDAKSAAPITGTRRGGGNGALTVDVSVQQQQ